MKRKRKIYKRCRSELEQWAIEIIRARKSEHQTHIGRGDYRSFRLVIRLEERGDYSCFWDYDV